MAGSAAAIHHTPVSSLALRVAGDERLLRLAASGNEAAFATLYGRHHQDLYRYCRTLVRHDQDAQDVLQTTMVRALAALQRGAPDAPARPWLFRIAHNEAVSLLRRRRPEDDLDAVAAAGGRPLEAQVSERARLRQLVADLSDLPERQRGALVMRELSGLSHEEIAQALGVGVAGAKQAICDARVSLQEFERGRAMDCGEVQRRISDGDGRALRGRPVRAHLRSCEACRSMREAIATRRADLAALAPALPATTAMGLLAQVLGGGGGAGGGGAAVGAAAGQGAVGALVAKGVAGAAIVATAGFGAVEVTRSERPGREAPAPAAAAEPTGAQGVRSGAARPAATTPASGTADTRRDPAPGPGGRRPAVAVTEPERDGARRRAEPDREARARDRGRRATDRRDAVEAPAARPEHPVHPTHPANGPKAEHPGNGPKAGRPPKAPKAPKPAKPPRAPRPAKPPKPVKPAPPAKPVTPQPAEATPEATPTPVPAEPTVEAPARGRDALVPQKSPK